MLRRRLLALRHFARRPALALVLSGAALVLAVAPWIGRVFLPADALSSALPLVPALAACALVLARSFLPVPAAIGALLLAAPILAPEVTLHRGAPATLGRHLVVVTHNVSTHNQNPQLTADILLASGADVILLQETNGPMQSVLGRLRDRFPFGSRCARPCSMMILSRWPTSRVRYRFRDAAGRPLGPALEQTEVQLPGLPPVPLVTLHLSRHRTWGEEAAERASLTAVLHQHVTPATVLGGDFNLTPWSAALHGLDAGLAPLRRETRAIFSWPARLGGDRFPVPLVPIDQLYAGPRWAVASVRRLPATGSDHYPVRAELVWQG